jgi:hypothetical protein
VNIDAGVIGIVNDVLDSNLIYQEGSTEYHVGVNTDSIADAGSTPFPLDESGITNMYMIPKRGGFHDITFSVAVKNRFSGMRDHLINSGYVQQGNDPATYPPLPFSVFSPLELVKFDPTGSPTKAPTGTPTKKPTGEPTKAPTDKPTLKPTSRPTRAPTDAPTRRPTELPVADPTSNPTSAPTIKPRFAPPGPIEEGDCPYPNTRTILSPSNVAIPVEHEKFPSYVLPVQK